MLDVELILSPRRIQDGPNVVNDKLGEEVLQAFSEPKMRVNPSFLRTRVPFRKHDRGDSTRIQPGPEENWNTTIYLATHRFQFLYCSKTSLRFIAPDVRTVHYNVDASFHSGLGSPKIHVSNVWHHHHI